MNQILYRVLSFDGGGIRGLYQAKLLESLKASGLDVVQRADIVAGTSTGAIVAAALAIGKSPEEIFQLYTDVGRLRCSEPSWKSNSGRTPHWAVAPSGL
jgi:patatin-like phospholipase/acyl hydrolase